MDQVITYNKTYQERLLEYTDVLSGYEVLSVSQIKKEWAFYLELTVDTSGWQAVWKIPRLKCEELKIAFPTIVLVYVENVNFQELTAAVKILAVQDDIHLPSKHWVSLIYLWLMKEQDKTVGLNITSTANSLDMLHFFYTNILMPWDLEEDTTTDWFSTHLESRLRLYYDMRNGTIPRSTAEHLKCLLTEARRLQARQEQITKEMEDIEMNLEDLSQNTDLQSLLNIRVRVLQIRSEVEILENPLLRKTLLQNQQQLQPKKITSQRENWLVFDQGKIEECLTFLNQVKTLLQDEDIRFTSTLAVALENASPNDRILLSKSRHVLNDLGSLQEGGLLKGLYSKTDTIITTKNDDVMLDCCGDIILENLTIDVDSAQCGIVIRCGTVTIKNCKIVGDAESSTHQGIIVLAGGKLSMTDCDITGFYTAIVGNSGSVISIKNCEISRVNVGLKIYDNCGVRAEGSQFHHCQDYGICVETDNTFDENVSHLGSFSVLEVIPEVTTENITGENNGKGDAIINHKFKLEPVRDLFGDSQFGPTILENESTDEEMEELNINDNNALDSTIIELKSSE